MDAMNHFARLGLAPSCDIDAGALENNYLALQKRHHPDGTANGTVSERRLAMEISSAVNEAYRVLRDPVRRVEYLCRLGGVDLDSSDPNGGAPTMSQSFLIEMIDRRDALEQTRARGHAALDELRAKVEREQDDALASALVSLRSGSIAAAAVALVERRYLQRLVGEIDGEV